MVRYSSVLDFCRAALVFILFVRSFQSQCVHDQLEHNIQINNQEYRMYYDNEDRALQQFQGIRIVIDYSSIYDL